MLSKDALVNLEHVCKAGRSVILPNIFSQMGQKQVKKGIKAFCSLSLILSFALYSPAISFAAIDHIGDYDGRTNNTAEGNGGVFNLSTAIYNSIQGNYSNNTATNAGGALYISGTSRINSIDGNFTGNTVTSTTSAVGGGAIFNNAYIGGIYGDFTNNIVGADIKNVFTYTGRGGAILNTTANNTTGYIDTISGTFTNNIAYGSTFYTGGGAIYNDGGFIGNILGTFNSNRAGIEQTNNSPSDFYDGGGAIFNYSGYIGNIIADFTNNKATNSRTGGGAIFNYGPTAVDIATIDSIQGTFTTNLGTNMGGAIYNSEFAIINYIDADFKSNSTTGSSYSTWGGALYNEGVIGSIKGTFENNYLDKLSVLDNYSYGGAIANTGTGSIDSITANFVGNYLIPNTGATNTIYLQGGALYNAGSIGTVSSNFTSNYIKTNINTLADGGAIYNVNAISSFINSSFTSNTVISSINTTNTEFGTARGGAIYNTSLKDNSSPPNIISSGYIGTIQANFDSNKATVLVNNAMYAGTAQGGAIFNEDSATISSILNSSFSNNIVELGNATASSSWGNNSTTAQGGALYNTANIGSIANTSFDNNSAKVGNASNAYVYPTAYSGGSATAQGGAIFNNTSTGIIGAITDTSFTNNSATSGNSSSYTNTYTYVQPSTAQGGAIYNASSAKIASISGYFENNRVTTGTGVSSTHSSNTSTVSGQASAHGGAIYNSSDITGSIIANFINNSATHSTSASTKVSALGGAIYNSKTIGGDIIGVFDGNKASGDTANISSSYNFITNYRSGGGAIYNDGASASIGTIKGTFSNNIANGNQITYNPSVSSYTYYYAGGGAIYNYNGTIAGIIADFIDNSTNHRGGAIYNTGTITNGIAGSFTGNTAGTLGGAVYSTTNLKFVADNAHYVFADNKDSTGYNAIYIVNTASTSATQRLLDFSLTGNSSYTINDKITGATNYNGTSYYNYGYYDLKITGESKDTNSFNLNALVNNARNVTIDNASLNLSAYLHEDGTTSTGSISANNISFNNANLAIDLSTANANPFLFATGNDSTSNSVGNASGDISVTDSTLTLNRVTASSSPILIAQDNTDTGTTNKWWKEEDLITTSLVNASIYKDASDLLWDNYKFAITLEVNTDNEIFDTEFSKMALASVDGTIKNNATLDFMQDLTHQDIEIGEQKRLIQGGTRISSLAGTATNATTAMVTSKNLVSARFDTADAYSFAQHGKTTQLASNGLIVQERGTNISIWGMPMFAHEVISNVEVGDFVNNYGTDIFGITAGIDAGFKLPFFDTAKIGVALNLGNGDTSTNGDYNNITNEFTFYGFNGYGALQKDKVRVHVNLGLTRSSSDLAYGINLANYTPTGVKAEVANNVLHVGTKAEYALYNKNNVEVTPYAGLEFININTADYDLQEDNATSATIFNMQVENQSIFQIPLGAKVSKTQVSRKNWVCLSQASLGAIVSAGNLSENSYAYAPNTSININHLTKNFDILTAEVGLAYKAQKNNFQWGLDVTGQLSTNRIGFGGALEVVYSF